MQLELSRFSKYVALAIVAVMAAGCKGSIEGRVLGTDGDPAVPVTGHAVYLLAATSETASALKAVCPALGAAELTTQANAERQRLTNVSAAYTDSLHDELLGRRDAKRVADLRATMLLYHDSAASVSSEPPPVPSTLIETLALKQVPSGDDGSYAFENVPPGQYLVAVELKDEYRWLPVQVGRRKAVADVRPRVTKSGCEVARAL
ncbi:MAG TPA: hypothetical protein VGM67_06485 [Gemmatimonadaceae bacterium]